MRRSRLLSKQRPAGHLRHLYGHVHLRGREHRHDVADGPVHTPDILQISATNLWHELFTFFVHVHNFKWYNHVKVSCVCGLFLRFRYLVKSYRQVRDGKQLSGIVSYLNDAHQHIQPQPTGSRPTVININDLQSLVEAYKRRAAQWVTYKELCFTKYHSYAESFSLECCQKFRASDYTF